MGLGRRAVGILAGAALCVAAAEGTATAVGSDRTSSTHLRVVVEPDRTMAFLDAAVRDARHSVLVELYELADPVFEADLAQRAAHHVSVRVLLDRDYDAGSVNAAAASWLRAHGVAVRFADADWIFHEKAVVVDGRTAYVGTGNLEARYYATTRDFWVVDTIAADVGAVVATFDADWTGTPPAPAPAGRDLVWSPDSEGAVLSLIGSARHSIVLETEEISSTAVVDALAAAARRHVAVHLVMTEDGSETWAYDELVAAGAAVHLDHGETPLYIHAKALCVDCTLGSGGTGKVLVGSQNLSTSSLKYNRELAIETTARSVVAPIDAVVRADFAAAAPYVR